MNPNKADRTAIVVTLRRSWIWLALAALIAAGLLARGLTASRPEAGESELLSPVRTIRSSRVPLVKTLGVNAYVESESMVTVVPLVSGILQEYPLEVGDRVLKGQVLARIDAARYTLQAKQAEAAWLSAQTSFDRVRQLFEAGATSQQNQDQAKANYDAYRTQWELAQLQLDYATVRSPVDGIVLVRHSSIGSIAAPERPLLTIGDLSRLIVRARIPERYYARFRDEAGSLSPRIEVGEGASFAASILTVAPFVSAENRTFEVRCALEEGMQDLSPGMSVVARFELERREDAISLPFETLVGSGELWFVDELDGALGVARKMPFRPSFSNDTVFAIDADQADKIFILEGQHFLKDGAHVRIVGEARLP